MKRSTLKFCVALILGISSVSGAASQFEHQEFAAETMNTRLGGAPLHGGTLYVKRCDHCPVAAVSVHAGTLYYHQKNRISADAAMAMDGKGSTVFYDPITKYVTRIVFWKN